MNEVVEEVTELQEQEDELIKTKEIIMNFRKHTKKILMGK